MSRDRRQYFEQQWHDRLEGAELYLNIAQEIRSITYHPWQRFKRTFAIIAFFNTIFGPTLFGEIARYKPEAIIAVEAFFGPVGLALLPLVNAVFMPALIATGETLFHKLCRCTAMPEPDAYDRVPFIIAVPIVNVLSHKVIGSTLSLNRWEATSLIVQGTLYQMIHSVTHTHDPAYVTILDSLYHDTFFTFVGQYFLFGKLVPALFKWLPDVILKPLQAKVQQLSDRLNDYGFRLFDRFHPGVSDDLLLERVGLS